MKTVFENGDIKIVRRFVAIGGKLYKLYDAFVGQDLITTKRRDFDAAFEAGYESARRRSK